MFVQQEKPTLVENKKSDSEPLNTETTEDKIANNYEDRLKSASGLGGKGKTKYSSIFRHQNFYLLRTNKPICSTLELAKQYWHKYTKYSRANAQRHTLDTQYFLPRGAEILE